VAKRRRGTATAPPGRVVGRARPIARVSTGERRVFGPAVLVALLVVGAIVVLGVALIGAPASPYACASQLQPQANATVENPIVTPDEGQGHVRLGTTTEYASCPPASGPHYIESGGVAPLRPAFYDPGARIGPGNWVHNLEHGFVVALYRCTDGQCPSNDVLSEFREFVLNGPPTERATACGYQSKVLAARFDDMATPFALVAWDHVLLLDAFDSAVGVDFARRWLEQPELPEANRC
jgi:hypothetical protein